MNRTVIAFLLAPLTVPAFISIYFWPIMEPPIWFVVALIMSTITAYFGIIVCGVPAHLWLHEHGRSAFWMALVLGLTAGMVVWLGFSVVFALLLDQGMPGVLFALTNVNTLKGVIWPGGLLGAVVGMTFWLIARPDRQIENQTR